MNIDCSIDDVETQEESACAHLLEPVVASSSLDEDCLQESDAFDFTDSDCSNSCACVAVESEENHSTRFKQTFQVFILATSAGWLRDFTLFCQNTLTKELAISTTSYLRPLQGLDYNAMY